MPIPAFMILSVLSDCCCRCRFIFTSGWLSCDPWAARGVMQPRCLRGEGKVMREEEPTSCCSCPWVTFGQDWDRSKTRAAGLVPCGCQGQALLLLPPLQGTPAPPSDPPPLCESKQASQRTPGVWRQRWVLCCLSSVLSGESSGCKRRPPWQEALLSASSAPPACVHQLADLTGGSMTHGEHGGAQFFSSGSHFKN